MMGGEGVAVLLREGKALALMESHDENTGFWWLDNIGLAECLGRG